MYIYIYLISVVAEIVLLAITWKSAYMDSRRNKLFSIVIGCNVIVLLGYAARILVNDGDHFVLNYIVNTLIYVLGSLVCYFILLTTIKRNGLIFKIVSCYQVLMLLFLLTSPWTHLAFYVDGSGIYQRGVLNSIVFISNGLSFALWIAVLAVKYRNVEFRKRFNIYLLGIFQLAAILIEMLSDDFKALYVGGAFLLGIYYVFMMEVEGRYDQMTGVYSKRYYYSEIERLNINSSYIVFMIDVNGLKYINDNFGHEKGDLVIKSVSRIVWETVHSKAKVFRIGGDEFVGLTSSMNEPEIKGCFEEIANKLKNESRKLDMDVDASIGYSIHNAGEEFQEVLRRADEIMYEAKTLYYKRTGKGRD